MDGWTDGTGQVFTVGIMTLLSPYSGRKTKQQQLTISYNGIDGIIIWEQAVIRGLVMGEDGPKHCLGLGVLGFYFPFQLNRVRSIWQVFFRSGKMDFFRDIL